MGFEFKTLPFPHQQEAFDRFKNHPHLALLADMGTGKTKIAIDISAYKHLLGLHDRILVIAPNAVHPQWIDEQLPLHCPVPWRGFSYSSNKSIKFLRLMDRFLFDCKNQPILSVFTMNFEAFARPTGLEIANQFLRSSQRSPVIVVDEASRIKNPSAKTVKNIKKLRELYPDSFRVIITGTPAAKSPVDMWSIFDFLKKQYMGCTYIAFQHEHAITVQNKIKVKNRLITVEQVIDPTTFNKIHKFIYNNTVNGKINPYVVADIKRKFGLSDGDFWFIAGSDGFQRFKNIGQLQEKIAPVTFSVSKKDCLKLPDKIYKYVHLELNPKQKQLIEELTKHSVAVYQGHELTLEVKALLGLRVLQICGGFFSSHTDIEGQFKVEPIEGKNAKLEYIKEDLREIGEQQFMVWAVFSPEIQLLNETLSKEHSIGVLDGSVEKDERADVVNDFKKGRLQGLISHPEVGGYGLNLQGAGIQYWYSRNYRTEARLQAEDRSHRIGTVKSPIYKDLLYNLNFEHQVLKSLKEGSDLNAHFLSKDINELFKIM
jgi:SNF2 family DNA or RNA helicase